MDDKEKQQESSDNKVDAEKNDFVSKIGHKLGLSHLQNDTAKRNKTIIIAIVTILFFSLIIAVFMHNSTLPQKKIVNNAPVSLIVPSGLAKHNWIVNNSAKLNKQSERLKSLESTVKSLKKHLNEEKIKKSSSIKGLAKPSFNSFPPPPVYNGNGSFNNPLVTKPKAKPIYRTTSGLIGTVSLVVKKNNTGVIPNNALARNKPASVNPVNSPKSHKENILPGSFAKAVLLTGAEVPTSGGGSVGPVPVLMRVISDDQLPNFFKTNIQNCFMLGQATGSLSSGRAYIRLSKLSCVSKNGVAMSKSITATAVGEDGKVGLAGKVVTKQGALLARVLVAGFLQGVGQAFQQSSENLSFSGLTGSTTQQPITPSGRELLSVGLGGGVSQATQKLAQFYMNMANKMFPVIQINAGRKIDVMFLKGAYLP
jgi:conjugal transfer pilus assembly protein TraB